MTFKLQTKLFLLTGLTLLSIIVSFYYVSEVMHRENLNVVTLKSITQAEYAMHDHEKMDIATLSTAMKVFLENEEFKDIFLSRDRERLFTHGQPMFNELKEGYGVTHFYFHLPDGINFVRLHNKEIFGDRVNRVTFKKAQATGKFAGGIELGKTAFALRVVAPYYKGNDLIGYVEIGHDIDHFLDNLKSNSNNEFALIARKEFLNRDDWASVRRSEGLPDNWDQLRDYLWISKTTVHPAASSCFTDKNIVQFGKGTTFIKRFPGEKAGFACGGFPVHDAGGRVVGSVLALIDVSDQMALIDKTRRYVGFVFVSLSLLAFISVALMMRRSISRPIEELSRAADIIASGNLTHRVSKPSGDEIGHLADAMNKMASQIDSYCTNLQEMVDERTIELRNSEELAKTVTETAGDAVICLEAPDIINRWNKKAEEMFGFKAEETMGKELHNLIIPERYREKHMTGLASFFKTGSGPLVGRTTEISALRRDGSEFPIELSISAMKIHEQWQTTGIIRDITERKKAELEISTQRDELKRINGELAALYQVAMSVSRTIDLQKLLYDILYTIVGLEMFSSERKGGIFVVEKSRMELVSSIGLDESFLELHGNIRVGECLCGMAAKTGNLIVSDDSEEDKRHTLKCPGMERHGHVIVPLTSTDRVVGVLCLYTPPGSAGLKEDTRELLISIGGQIGIAIENSRLYEETKALALSDHLTGLANRRYMDIFLDRAFTEAKRYGRMLSIIMADIDHFKRYNDSKGHQAGDQLITQVARILLDGVREADLVARYGGEEFIIMLPETGLSKATDIAERLRNTIGKKTEITISLGVSSYEQGAETKMELVHMADSALYQAKERGRNQVVMAA